MRSTASEHAKVKSRKRLLLVEDDDSVVASLRLVLNGDYDVHSASTISSGIELFTSLKPALVVLDLRLQDGEGLEVLRKIRGLRSRTPVIVLTGYASMRTVEEALRLGASDYLHKPFDSQRLRKRIRQLTAASELMRQPQMTEASENITLPASKVAELEHKAMASGIFLHDAANPVTAALSAAQFVCETIENTPEQFSAEMRDACDLLSNAMGFLSGLFEQSGSIECVRTLEKSEVALHRIVDVAVNMVQMEAAKNKVLLSIHLQNGGAKAFVNRFALARVLLNLLRNAIAAAAPKAGKVVLSANIADDFAEFSIRDNGPGIPPEIMERIFDAQFTTKADGNGLGLYICKCLVEVMKGTLSVRNEPNQGCCFSIKIPCENPCKI